MTGPSSRPRRNTAVTLLVAGVVLIVLLATLHGYSLRLHSTVLDLEMHPAAAPGIPALQASPAAQSR